MKAINTGKAANVQNVTMHLSSKTPATDILAPYPISRQNHKVFYQKDINGYWNFVQCNTCDSN